MAEKKATEIRREEIIEAALALVEQHGFENLNIAGIAAAINLVPSAIYRFNSPFINRNSRNADTVFFGEVGRELTGGKLAQVVQA